MEHNISFASCGFFFNSECHSSFCVPLGPLTTSATAVIKQASTCVGIYISGFTLCSTGSFVCLYLTVTLNSSFLLYKKTQYLLS